MENKYYVYVYYDDNMVPYYIGKGCGTRITDVHGSVEVPEKKYRKKIKENLCEEEAFIIESQLIRYYGRKVDGGILENIMPGCDEDYANEFYSHKKWLKEQDEFWKPIFAENDAEWERQLNQLRHIKNNCPEEWNRIKLEYHANYYDEDQNEQVETILNENENQLNINEICF